MGKPQIADHDIGISPMIQVPYEEVVFSLLIVEAESTNHPLWLIVFPEVLVNSPLYAVLGMTINCSTTFTFIFYVEFKWEFLFFSFLSPNIVV